MYWTDRIRQVKIILVAAAVVIAVVSLVVSHILVTDLADEERARMEIWAAAMRSFNMADENTDLELVLKVMNENNTIPLIVLEKDGDPILERNFSAPNRTEKDSIQYIRKEARALHDAGRYIRIDLGNGDYNDVCYADSLMLKRLTTYPYVQLGVVLIFVVIAIFALLTSKKAEQNKVWVGLSKETAHQLGTPISSLMAWTEMLKETYPDDDLIPEMDKDVKRLQLIAERFSKIGSLPEPVPASLTEVMQHVVEYMDRRTSSKVKISMNCPEQDIIVKLNAQLFEWVIENLCKNAVDAMEGAGSITLTVFREGRRVVVEVADTGKGIAKKNIKNVFRPGFTTKKRGWGLGLSLAKRIVEEYHNGKIFVKSSEVGKGTVFRIELTEE